MKVLLTMFFSFIYLFAVDPIMLPLKGVKVIHQFSNGVKKEYTIQREVAANCMDVAINVENFQSGNLASKNIDDNCKKSFIVTKGTIQPLSLVKGVKSVAELEVLDFIANKSSKNPDKYILVDSRRSDWFNAGTIPSAVNIPYDELSYDEDFEFEYERAYELLGVKVLGKDKFDFSNAKTALFFCNGSWCAQSPRAIIKLVNIGYPKDKILWYRGGIAAWAGVSLTLTKKAEAKK
ncbi:rhodanese-like domain-containing protein [Halarcobacter anaerophilus]|jgi:rhodanese-related sulfurtransferase|uniref:Rhodanese-like domain-containing protein n=1 Tax=Halarcobacter anaerophilus TaxID=877500 RepID=A0A4Q0XWU0_9BACT|nr:rhodanese-like domain-containing protein [Halarcobacter anaerophilus]QDF28295.1 rhodanese-like domain-containing protein [Halarcobacter anaerophilus]RXJ62036.1 rhodanese-like domain-containing protein [Halarcobacter anaerophilus]